MTARRFMRTGALLSVCLLGATGRRAESGWAGLAPEEAPAEEG